MTGGFQNSDLILLGARPSIGKTALALSMAANIAGKQKTPAAFFSLEMSSEAVGRRLFSMFSGVEGNKIRKGMLELGELGEIRDAAALLEQMPFYIVDKPNMQLMDIRSQARRLVAQYGVRIMFIDYFGLIESEKTRGSDMKARFEEMSENSRSIKSLARELRIPIVALVQLARTAEGNKPNLAQIRDTGSLEQDADVVMFLHRDREEDKKARDSGADGVETDLIVEKQRNGETGLVKLYFKKQFTLFTAQAENAA
jgi:replicative DNA helicase